MQTILFQKKNWFSCVFVIFLSGWEELKFIAIRYQRVFPHIWESVYNPVKFSFRYSKSQRTEASFKAFVEGIFSEIELNNHKFVQWYSPDSERWILEWFYRMKLESDLWNLRFVYYICYYFHCIGLFGPNAHERINVPPPPVNDTLLKPYAMCPPHKHLKNPEYDKFAEFIKSRTIPEISQRLGYKFALKLEQVLDMFNMCKYLGKYSKIFIQIFRHICTHEIFGVYWASCDMQNESEYAELKNPI